MTRRCRRGTKAANYQIVAFLMASASNTLAIGLTGSFGSGCSTLARALASRGFQPISLSLPLKENWSAEKKRPPEEAPRGDLQDMGNMFAGSQGKDHLAKLAWKRGRAASASRLVFDGIKREDEVAFLRGKFPNFYLVAVLCEREERWNRAKDVYMGRGLNENSFNADDVRDQIEEVSFGQQVALCVDDADIVINNNKHTSITVALKNLRSQGDRYLGLMTEDNLCAPTQDEIFMSMAYAQAERSGCIKRHVGAIIVDNNGSLVSAGFNENPSLRPCYQELGYCRKDELMSERLEEQRGKFCPNCGKVLDEVSPPWRCKSCGVSLKAHYFSDHGVRWCQAIHGEERAIGAARDCVRPLERATLYTTTFPCLNCAKLVSDARIGQVVYVEPYPEKEAVAFLTQSEVPTIPFEGVKARAFHRLFKPFRAFMEKQYQLESA